MTRISYSTRVPNNEDRPTESKECFSDCGLQGCLRVGQLRLLFPPVFASLTSSPRIQRGFLLLVGISTSDTEDDVAKLSNKVLKLRLFDHEETGASWKHNISEAKGAQILSGKCCNSDKFKETNLLTLSSVTIHTISKNTQGFQARLPQSGQRYVPLLFFIDFRKVQVLTCLR